MQINLPYDPQNTTLNLIQNIFYGAADLIEVQGIFSGVLQHGASYRFDGFITNAKVPGKRSGVLTITSYYSGTAPVVHSYSIIDDKLQNPTID